MNTTITSRRALRLLAVCCAAAITHISIATAADWTATVVGWGDNSVGQLPPVGASGLTRVRAIAAGMSHSLALRSDGTVFAWGDNGAGQTNVPAVLQDVRAIAAGGAHSLALHSAGVVVAWGSNSHGQTTVPGGLVGVRAIAAGSAHSLALTSGGEIRGWGDNTFGQGSAPLLIGFKAIAAGGMHNLALFDNGTVFAWGNNQGGQTTVPAGLSGVVAIAAGYGHSLALKSDGKVVAWGSNASGQTNVPAGLSGVIAIAGGLQHSLALKSDGTVVAWGGIGFGALGITNVPTGLSQVRAIAAGTYHNLALAAPATLAAMMISPPPGYPLISAQPTFTWGGGIGVQSPGYALWVGNNPNTYDIYAAVQGMNLSKTLTLPTDGRTLYVTLHSWINGAWQGNRYTYAAATAAKAVMTSPANGSKFNSANVTFTWNAGIGVSKYALWVGSTAGSYDLYAQWETGLSRTVTLPTDGRAIFVRLFSEINGALQFNDYTYTAAGP